MLLKTTALPGLWDRAATSVRMDFIKAVGDHRPYIGHLPQPPKLRAESLSDLMLTPHKALIQFPNPGHMS